MKRIVLTLCFSFGSLCAHAQPAPPLSVAGDDVLLTVSAVGVQVYECRAATGGAPEWAFKEPRAELFVQGKTVGRHFAGPSWEYADGSRIVGQVQASIPAPQSGDIPWLRLTAASHSGEGVLAAVTAVQRINTHGGVLSGSCPETGARSEVPYTADYVMLRRASS